MISVSAAEQIVLQTAKLLPSEIIALPKAYGRVLREDIQADRDQPAFNKSTVDGIAIASQSWQKGNRRFAIEAVIPAGQNAMRLKNPDGCVQIMTGAVVPPGCDCVIPIERVTLDNKVAVISADAELQRGQNIRYQSADCKKRTVVLKQGCRLWAPQIATTASFGKAKIKVTVKPNIAIIATGDELVDIDRKNIKPYQIRLSNSYALDAMVRQTDLADAEMFHLRDDKKILLREIKKILTKFDVLILSGGVSMGEFDFVPQVLSELGVKVLFHKVAQKPGRPFWFGVGQKGKAVFALPGNPVSTQICAYRYVIPYLMKSVGLPSMMRYAVLGQDFESKTDLTYFAPVKISSVVDGTLVATPTTIGGSGDYASLAQADGFVELAARKKIFKRGAIVPVYVWKI